MSDHESTPLSDELAWQSHAIGQVITALAKGDFTQKVSLDAPAGVTWEGEPLEVAATLNGLVDHLSLLSDEVTRVARELGTEGILGGHAYVPNATGTWKDLLDNFNFMASSLTVQVRSLSDTAHAAIDGDTTRRVIVEAKGEMKELRDALNVLIERAG